MNNKRQSGMTLIEVMVAVMILAIVGFVMMRFVSLNTAAIASAVTVQIEENRIDGFLSWIRSQLVSLETGSSTLTGDAHEFEGEFSSDEISWTTTAGSGTFSQSGQGKYLMKLELERAKGEQPPRLWLRRQKMPDEGDRTTADPGLPLAIDSSDSSETGELVLLNNTPGLEIRYFDARVNSWVKRWTDTATFPSLVKVKIWLPGGTQTRETTVRIPPIAPNRSRPNRQVRVGGANEEEQPDQPNSPNRPNIQIQPGTGGRGVTR